MALVLVTSELDIFQEWFAKYFPLIGPHSALVTLGCIEVRYLVSSSKNRFPLRAIYSQIVIHF